MSPSPRQRSTGRRGDWGCHSIKSLISTKRDEAARQNWRTKEAINDSSTLLFLDKSSTQTIMTRCRSRDPRGVCAVGSVPRELGQNVTCLVASGMQGPNPPYVFQGAVDGSLFGRWVQKWLIPRLAPSTTAVLDTLSVHRNSPMCAIIEAAGCKLRFLPAYLPTHPTSIRSNSHSPI